MLAVVGGLTFLIGSLSAITASDAKRVLAHSTVANLGLIVLCGGLGSPQAVWAGIFLLVGLHLLGVIPAPWSAPGRVGLKLKVLFAAFVLGLVFGIALGPCTFAYMAPILAVTFKVADTAPFFAAALLLAYGVGHCAVIVGAGTATECVQRFLNWNETSKGIKIMKGICGVLVLLAGAYFLWTA